MFNTSPTALPGAVVAWDSESATVGGIGAVTVSVAVDALVLAPSEVLRFPGETVTGNDPATALCALTVTVQLPIAEIVPDIPRSIELPETNGNRPTQVVAIPESVRPGTDTVLPSTTLAGPAFGLASVSVMVALVATGTLGGAKPTVMVGVGVAVIVSGKLVNLGALGVSPE